MVSFEESMSEIGRRLALLLAEPEPVPAASLTAALAGRESTLQLLDTLLADGAIGRRAKAGGVTELARNPTGVMNALRARGPRLAAADSHEVLVTEPHGRAETLWAGVHRHAVVARHQWETADRASRPTGKRAWPLTADSAALTAALTHLDAPLAGALRLAGRTTDAELLEQTRWSGLDVAAREVWALAHRGDLTDSPPLRAGGVPNPVVVRSGPGQREGGRRLLTQLELAHLSPQALSALLNLHGQTALAAAQLLEGPVAARLVEHAREAHQASRRLNAVTTIEGSDQRAVMQAHQLKTFVEAELRTGRRAEVGLTVARQAPQIIAAINERASIEVREGRWLVPDAVEHDQPLWIQADMGDHRPAALGYLTAATVAAVEVGDLAGPDLAPAAVTDARLEPPRETLAQAIRSRLNVTRPDEPAARLAPPTAIHPEQQVHL